MDGWISCSLENDEGVGMDTVKNARPTGYLNFGVNILTGGKIIINANNVNTGNQ